MCSAKTRAARTPVKAIRDHLKSSGSSSRYDQKRIEITEAAAACFEAKGVSKTSILDISAHANITRELVYYYFSGKKSIVEAVVDLYAVRVSESLSTWIRRWTNDDELLEEVRTAALQDLVQTMRVMAFADTTTLSPMFRVLAKLDSVELALSRSCFIAAGAQPSIAPRTLSFVIMGSFALMRAEPSLSDVEIARAIRQLTPNR